MRNRAKAKPVAPHKAITRKCRLCGKPHTRQAHRSHGIGAYLRTHHPQPSPVTAQAVYDRLLQGSADLRIKEFLKYMKSGETKLTGRAKVDRDGNVIGRFGGGTAQLFPEIANLARAPGRLASSLEGKRSTQLQQDIRWQFLKYTEGVEGQEILAYMDAHPLEAVAAAGFKAPGQNPPAKCGAGIVMYGRLLRMVMQRPPNHKCNEDCRAAHHVYFHDFTEPDWLVVGSPDKKSLTIRKGA